MRPRRRHLHAAEPESANNGRWLLPRWLGREGPFRTRLSPSRPPSYLAPSFANFCGSFRNSRSPEAPPCLVAGASLDVTFSGATRHSRPALAEAHGFVPSPASGAEGPRICRSAQDGSTTSTRRRPFPRGLSLSHAALRRSAARPRLGPCVMKDCRPSSVRMSVPLDHRGHLSLSTVRGIETDSCFCACGPVNVPTAHD